MRLRVNPIQCVAHELCGRTAARDDPARRVGLPDHRGRADTGTPRACPPRRQRVSYPRPAFRARRQGETFSSFCCGRCQRAGRAGRLRRRVDWTDHLGIRLHALERRASSASRSSSTGSSSSGPSQPGPRRRQRRKPVRTERPRRHPSALPARSRRALSTPANPVRPRGHMERPAGGAGRPLTVGCRDAFVKQPALRLRLHSGTTDAGTVGLALRARDRRPGAQAPRSGVQRRLPVSVGAGGFESFGRRPRRCATDLDRSSPTPTEPPISAAGTTEVPAPGRSGRLRPAEPPPADRPRNRRPTLDCPQLLGRDPRRGDRPGSLGARHPSQWILIWAGAEHATVSDDRRRAPQRRRGPRGRARHQPRMGRRLPVRTSRPSPDRSPPVPVVPGQQGIPGSVPRAMEPGLLHDRREVTWQADQVRDPVKRERSPLTRRRRTTVALRYHRGRARPSSARRRLLSAPSWRGSGEIRSGAPGRSSRS